MSLDEMDRFQLYEAGFTQKEIKEIAEAVDPKGNPQPPVDLNDAGWQSAIKNRVQFTNRIRANYRLMHGKDLTRMQADRIINQWYKTGQRKTPFDWLNEVYAKGKKIKSDFMKAKQAQIRKQHRELGGRFIR